MNSTLCSLLNEIVVGEPMGDQGLRLTPLKVNRESKLDYLTLDEAIGARLATIEEVSAGGSVPQLRVVNQAGKPLFIRDGMMLVGVKQNRVVNVNIMLAPESATVIPVSCVEHGRWSFKSDLCTPSWQSDAQLRRMMAAATTASLEKMKKVSVDQGAVWAHVDAMLGCAGAMSPTQAYHAVYEKWEQECSEYEGRLACPQNACGVAVQIGGTVEAVDLFDKPATLRKLWPKLLKSHIVAALGAVEKPSEPSGLTDVREFVDRVLHGNARSFESVGIGTSMRLTADGTVGAALLCDDEVVHLSVFADGKPRGHSGPTSQDCGREEQPLLRPATEANRPRPWWKFWR